MIDNHDFAVEFCIVAADPDISPECSDPVLTQATLRMLEQIMVAENAKGWDLPPIAGPLYLRDRTPVGPEPMAGVWMEFTPWEILTTAMRMRETPWLVFAWLGEEAQTSPAPPLSAETVAFVFVSEMWELPGSDDPKENERRATLRSIQHHPARVESRMVSAVDVRGVHYHVRQPRGGQMSHRVGPWPFGGEGVVADALEYFLLSLDGRNLPSFNEWAGQRSAAG